MRHDLDEDNGAVGWWQFVSDAARLIRAIDASGPSEQAARVVAAEAEDRCAIERAVAEPEGAGRDARC
ncbi:hypothetical protein GCM10011490_19550 [Pseudoclavibacter endophyticus]|uniref:hypothetical protein n=1 Tax=Pseudoclavibacter endophyticus TaxID=1778590 RepID=UPI0016678A7F|nr:hypothetical protein [Pseudoclavibacter endophyticus]GGA69089.1 hypothetical protein GCM10011490_19550 [Pseudoclavibacter endophyticus]